jgi:hypothetical protein
VNSKLAELCRLDLAGADGRQVLAAGVFYLSGAVCRVTFESPRGLETFLDYYFGEADDTMAVVAHLTPQGAEFPSANLRFQVNRRHQVAAALLIATDKHGRGHSWMTLGEAGRDDVVLAHDSWNPGETTFPSGSFITLPELRALVEQWAFGDTLPPLAVRWRAVCPTSAGSDAGGQNIGRPARIPAMNSLESVP